MAPKPKRISENKLEWQDYHLRVRAADAVLALKAARDNSIRHKWENMSKRKRREEELFFSFDIDFNRINLSDAPARRDLVSDKAQIMQPAPAGGATSPGIKVSHTPSQWDLGSDKQMMQPAPAGGATSLVPSFCCSKNQSSTLLAGCSF